MTQHSHFHDFHEQLTRDNSLLAAAGQQLQPGQALCWQIGDSESYVYERIKNGLKIIASKSPADLIIKISPSNFQHLINEELSLFGLIYANKLEIVKGDFTLLNHWYSAIQQLFYGRPIWRQDMATPLAAMDLNQSFDLRRDRQSASHFLQTCGFVHLKQVFSADEIANFTALVNDQVGKATVDDQQSWWAKNTHGDTLCCRLTYLNQKHAIFRSLATDPRMLAIAALADQQLLPAGNRMDGINCVMKHSNIVEGISDLAWHKDCDLGGHHLICPGLIVGVQLDRADAENGQLHFLAGSQHSSNTHIDGNDPDLPLVAVETEPGDVTAHFCHVSHEAPAPKGEHAQRNVLYAGFYQQKLLDAIPEEMSYNDVLFTQGDGLLNNLT
ncbi:Uncharacterised protein [BD1-7 clade bacterium]|uniref:Phytanoyl-CoA dioxygenase n=1 Tax=BD1-7 clade bacterium TaxID=2029982 RepID=A0A5S9MNS3_9GAMM|nr:Uncharacterised protein [BD1-7 clade bacterium]